MRRIPSAFIIGGVVFLFGCASPGGMRSSRNSLDRAIQYTEITHKGERIPLSRNGTQVPDGVGVDINSAIEIRIDTAAVQLVQGYQPIEASSLFPGSRAQKLSDALAALNRLIESRKKAVAAYEKMRGMPASERLGSPEYAEFDKASSEFGLLQSSFNSLPIWSDGTFPENVDLLFTKTYEKIGPLLQRELAAAQAALQSSIDKANRDAASLQLEAFLIQPKGAPLPIHLDGYDAYLSREAKLKSGFVMDADDKKVFDEQYAQTVRLARQAEQVRNGETTLNDALMASGSSTLQQLAEEAKGFEPLLSRNWPETAKTLQQDLRNIAGATTASLKRQGQVEATHFDIERSSIQAALSTDLPITELGQFIAQVKSLRQEWGQVMADNFLETFDKTRELPREFNGIKYKLKAAKLEQTQAALAAALADLQKRPAAISEGVWQEVLAEMVRLPSFQNAQAVEQQLQSAVVFAKSAGDALKLFARVDPVETGIRPPEVKDIPLADASGTKLELTKTPRLDDEEIAVAASLHVGQTEVMKSDSRFTVHYFGSHSVLTPSVILARPYKADTGADKNFQFAPAVAWLYKYYPRDDEHGVIKEFARLSQGGIGMHVAFLNQNTQRGGGEIGIGGAVSLWHDLLLAGAGVNLMNNSKGYLYVGSNLIPILQALGYGNESGSGVKR